jgi:hypothetical protein
MKLAVENAPARNDLKLHLARALFKADRMADIVLLLRPLATGGDPDPEILYLFGRAALNLREDELAVDALRATARGGYSEAFTYLAEALLIRGRPDEAIEAALRGVAHPTSDFKSLSVIVERCSAAAKSSGYGTFVSICARRAGGEDICRR